MNDHVTKEYSNLPDHSRVWIYQSPRQFSEKEIRFILDSAEIFLDEWTSHGRFMKAGVAVLHNQFVIVSVDEETAPPSGCGIDKSIRFISEVSSRLGVDLLNRMNVAFRKGDEIETLSLSEFEEAVKAEEFPDDVRVFNNLVEQKGRLATDWEVPASQSWHARFWS